MRRARLAFVAVALTFTLRQALPVFRYDHIDLSEPMAAASTIKKVL
jgi:hypothetical protein